MKSSDLKKIKSTFLKINSTQHAALACLVSVIKYYDGNAEIRNLLTNSGVSVKSIDLVGLCKVAKQENFKANGYIGSIGFLKKLKQPAIIHIERDSGDEDFIVLYGWHENKFIVGIPQWGIIEYREEELEAVWKSKTLILLEPDSSFKTTKEKKQFKRKCFWELLVNQKTTIILTGILGLIVAEIVIIVFPFIFKYADKLFNAQNIKQLFKEASILFFLGLLVLAIVYLNNGFMKRGIQSLVTELYNKLTKNIFSSFTNRNALSEGVVSALSNVIFKFCNSLFKLVSGIPFFVLLQITTLVYFLYISVFVTVVLLFLAFGLVGMVWYRSKKTEQLHAMRYQSEIQKTETMRNNFYFLEYVKLTNNEKPFTIATRKVLDISLDKEMSLMVEKDRINAWIIIVFLAVLIFYFSALNFLVNGDVNQLLSIKFLGRLFIYFWAMIGITNILQNYFHLRASFNSLYHLFGKDFSQKEEKLREDLSEEIPFINTFSVNNLSSEFPSNLSGSNNFSFVAEKGNITAIFGRTGSGKSVIVSILSRLLPMSEGKITLEQTNWRKISDFHWREKISIVSQPVQLFNVTLLENIGWSAKSFEPDKIISFCKKTGIDKQINEFPNGYASSLKNISAGQKQLVAFTAALYRKPKVLLLDEPFAYMDEEMFEFCWDMLQELKKELLVIIFTGNNLIKSKADKVFCLLKK